MIKLTKILTVFHIDTKNKLSHALKMRLHYFSIHYLLFSSLLLFSTCGSKFPNQNISSLISLRDAHWVTDTASSYSVHGGYSSSCPHPGAHAIFATAGTYNVYAVSDGIVSLVEDCKQAGSNSKYNITLALGMKGSVPVYFEYSIEPFGGTSCNSGGVNFSDQILVKTGDQVTKGQVIAIMRTVGSSAHIHFNLKADGATICPEIFPASIFGTKTGTIGSSTCGAQTIGTQTLCHGLTESEDPQRLL